MPLLRNVTWFLVGTLCGCAVMAWYGRTAPEQAPTPVLVGHGNAPRPSRETARINLESSLQAGLKLPAGMQRSRDFLIFLEGIGAGNWQSEYEKFSAATMGRDKLFEMELQQLLARIGEISGQEGVAFFLACKATDKANAVLTSWASVDPKSAWAYFKTLPDTPGIMAAMLNGAGRHGIESLIDLPAFISHNFGKELMAAARLQGSPADGERLWRNSLAQLAQDAPEPNGRIGSPVLFSALTDWQVEVAKSSGNLPAAQNWLKRIVAEGYRMSEDDVAKVVSCTSQSAPRDTLLWACELAQQFDTKSEQQARIARQQGFPAAMAWAKQDAEALSKWLTANPSHLGYDTGAAALYHHLKQSDPAAAAAWGAEVKDVSLRQWVKLEPRE